MIIRDVLKENGFVLTPKGREYFFLAMKDIYPGLKSMDESMIETIFNVELKDEDCLPIINLAIRYLKISAFS